MLELIDLFVQRPGDFFYHVVVVLSLSAGLGVALGQLSKRPQSRTATRYSLAVGGALLGWFILMAGALFSVFANQDARAILPPVERAAIVAAMLLIGWAFLTADSDMDGNYIWLGLFMLLMTTVIGYIITGLRWANLVDILDFNLSQFGVAWTFIQSMTALLGLVLMLGYYRTIIDAPLKTLFFAILLAGFGGTLWQMANGGTIGDYSGLSRLAVFVAMPIVPLVIYRKIVYGYELALDLQSQSVSQPVPAVPIQQQEPDEQRTPTDTASVSSKPFSKAEIHPQSSPVERESVQLLRTLGLILEEARPADIPQRIVKAALEVLKADVGALLEVKDANYADIVIAYDRAVDRPIPTMISLNLEQQVTLVNSIERKLQRPLFVDRNPIELEDLYNRLDVSQIGSAYFQPLLRDDDLMGILVIGLPYSRRELRDSERELLKGIGIISGSLLALSSAASDAEMRAEERAIQAMVTGKTLDDVDDADVLNAKNEMQAALDAAREHNQELQRQVALLKLELDDERTRFADMLGDTKRDLSVTQRIMALNTEHKELQEERDQLSQRLQEAETALATATGVNDDDLFNAMIETLNREKTELLGEMARLRDQLDTLREKGNDAAAESASELLHSMGLERARLQKDRDRLSGRLGDIESQLQALGLEGGSAGLATMVQQLYEQRLVYQAKTEVLRVQRDALLNERQKFEQRMRREEEREVQLETMEAEIRHLAADREAITRQRDQIRTELNDSEAKVDKLKEQRARLLAKVSDREERLAEMETQLDSMREKYNDIVSQAERQKMELVTVKSERDQLLARIDGDRGKIQQLSEDARTELMAMLADVTAQRDKLESELSEAITELSVLQGEQAQIAEDYHQPSRNSELLMSMVQELRTPMTSVLGFVDLLVTESAGILSEPQRDFVQRISANIVRMDTMINDIVHLTALDTKQYHLKLVPLNLVQMIEEAITHSAYQFRDKELALNLAFDDEIPNFFADYMGIHQVVGQLLNNAYLVSAEGGSIAIVVEQQLLNLPRFGKDPVKAVVVSVRDSGGGIAPDDLDEVFAWRYRPEHRLIEGVGDTSVGLSIAKAVIEAHGGEMWVNTEARVGTTFNFALPMSLQPEPQNAT